MGPGRLESAKVYVRQNLSYPGWTLLLLCPFVVYCRHLESELGRLKQTDPVKSCELPIEDVVFNEDGKFISDINSFISRLEQTTSSAIILFFNINAVERGGYAPPPSLNHESSKFFLQNASSSLSEQLRQ
jgi:hypothetical protein